MALIFRFLLFQLDVQLVMNIAPLTALELKFLRIKVYFGKHEFDAARRPTAKRGQQV